MKNCLYCKFLLMSALFVLNAVVVKAQHAGTIDTSQVREIRINPKGALAEGVEADDIFASVEYIPLEVTKNSLFGKIDQMEILDGRYIILDKEAFYTNRHWTCSVLIFDKDGKFHARIDEQWTKLVFVRGRIRMAKKWTLNPIPPLGVRGPTNAYYF